MKLAQRWLMIDWLMSTNIGFLGVLAAAHKICCSSKTLQVYYLWIIVSLVSLNHILTSLIHSIKHTLQYYWIILLLLETFGQWRLCSSKRPYYRVAYQKFRSPSFKKGAIRPKINPPNLPDGKPLPKFWKHFSVLFQNKTHQHHLKHHLNYHTTQQQQKKSKKSSSYSTNKPNVQCQTQQIQPMEPIQTNQQPTQATLHLERACHPIIKLCSTKIGGVLNRLKTLVPNILWLPKDQTEIPKVESQYRRRGGPLPKMRFLDVGSKVQDGLTFVWRNSKKVQGIVLEGGSWREREITYMSSLREVQVWYRGVHRTSPSEIRVKREDQLVHYTTIMMYDDTIIRSVCPTSNCKVGANTD